jgi:hypothetical protein
LLLSITSPLVSNYLCARLEVRIPVRGSSLVPNLKTRVEIKIMANSLAYNGTEKVKSVKSVKVSPFVSIV